MLIVPALHGITRALQLLVRQDVKLTASNDDYYFVFEDFLYQVQCAARLVCSLIC